MVSSVCEQVCVCIYECACVCLSELLQRRRMSIEGRKRIAGEEDETEEEEKFFFHKVYLVRDLTSCQLYKIYLRDCLLLRYCDHD